MPRPRTRCWVVLANVDPPTVHLPAPHPVTWRSRRCPRAGWRNDDLDLYMMTEPVRSTRAG